MSLLTGFRILCVEQYGAGPFGTGFLASLGAEVIKIEQPEEDGDIARHVGPHFDPALPMTSSSLFFQSLNCGKKSIGLSLRSEEGRAVFRRLAAGAHAVVGNLRGDVPHKLGLTYEQLKEANPALVCGHLSGYGRTGERAHWPGYDYLMQAEAGYFSLTGDPDSPPARMGLSIIDYMTGVVLMLGVVSAMLDASRTGVGCDVDVALFDVALFNLNYLASWYLNAAAETTRQPRSAHPSLSPCQLYRTADGWIFLMCNKEKFWANLCDAIDRPEWKNDPQFATFADRLRNRERLTVVLDAVLQERATAEWLEVFAGTVPASPIHTVGEALSTAHIRESDRIATVESPGGQRVRIMRSPLRSSKPGPPLTPAPMLGEHTVELLLACGMTREEISGLEKRGVLR